MIDLKLEKGDKIWKPFSGAARQMHLMCGAFEVVGPDRLFTKRDAYFSAFVIVSYLTL